MNRAPVFVAPVGTPPTDYGAWTHVGYAEDVVLEASPEMQLPRRPVLQSEPCRRTALAIEGQR
ncbi:hypothetical protein [Streptomyces sp. NPDC085937]|uniref:hypothetical protein n=1 Tax=Streptomyces sp. NPDC085937 TaxID=3365742 RepID=UPI0037D707B4